MAFQFWSLPPEANHFRLSAGAGVAGHTGQIAAYQTAATTYLSESAQMGATTAATSTQWMGAGGVAMGSKSAELVTWNGAAGGFAEKAMATITAGVAAYSAALAASVHYSICIANRVREATLQATNFFGVNAIPIAQTDVEYAGFWANNAGQSTAYGAAVLPLVSTLQIPLTASPLGANPAGIGAAGAAVAAQAANTAAHALGAGLSQGAGAAAQAMSTGSSVASGAASAVGQTASGAQGTTSGNGAGQGTGTGTGQGNGTSHGESPAGAQDFMSQAQSMAGLTSAPTQALQGAASPAQAGQGLLSSATQMGQMGAGGANNPGMFGPGMGTSPGISALSAGAPSSTGLSGGNGGFAGGGSAVNAAWTKPTAGSGMQGTVGLPNGWWREGTDGTGKAPLAGPRTGGVGAGASGAGAPGMYGAGAPAGAGRGRSEARQAGEADQQVYLEDFGDDMPVFTDGGVVYATGQGG
ncbi:PPE domain-containing protein [Mycobacteroides abscessus subsp. abscessus]|uniref:PPE domain-containing protein n=1 Tax=Mycobacteroides abscessus TaxID=36809 RepID=UPI000314F372|nr:PPE domain-containing protein [Mycobacteroides abscessus]MDO3101067.1 PPE domain-containing protein [Mycobacteroides abscessus subsp. abscessus]MDO3185030.1 PPE domain-containing protein [Mycobacteroides abscessus subsp. abscessus]MDO3194346.1 PPE domain-containing protein [Mycobacteroides abscessus subsp. abscessus]MDO3287459.1 PPE domain-containing protein [Mycobacteroides abscessus subsp. abscessus]OLT84749.1 hypothetical protein BKG58_15925 [Mycobacteroides abscessus subsp. abscessus]